MNRTLVNSAARKIAVLAAVMMLAGCQRIQEEFEGIKDLTVEPKGSPDLQTLIIPEPINLLLPRTIRIHPFTGTRSFDPAGGIKGIDVRIEAKDGFGDPTKAFGDFRFELYTYIPYSPEPKGKRLAVWHESVIKPKKNLVHWDNIARRYQFKLQWDQGIPVGDRFVLAVTFTSPFTERLYDQRVFVAGQ